MTETNWYVPTTDEIKASATRLGAWRPSMNQVQTHNHRRQVRRSVSAESIQVTQENEAEIFAWLRELGYPLIERGRGVNLGCVVFGHHDWATSAVPYGHYLVREAGVLTHFTEASYHERGYATIDDTPASLEDVLEIVRDAK